MMGKKMGNAADLNPVLLKDLIIVIAVVVGVASSVVAMWRSGGKQKRVIMDQPLRTEMVERPLTRDAVGRLHRRVDVLEDDVKCIRSKMEADKVEIIKAGEARAVEMYRRMDAMPGRMIAMLKDTKGLLGS